MQSHFTLEELRWITHQMNHFGYAAQFAVERQESEFIKKQFLLNFRFTARSVKKKHL